MLPCRWKLEVSVPLTEDEEMRLERTVSGEELTKVETGAGTAAGGSVSCMDILAVLTRVGTDWCGCANGISAT